MLYLHVGTHKAGSTTIQQFLQTFQDRIPHHQVDEFGIGNAWRIAAACGEERARAYWVRHLKALSNDDFDRVAIDFWPRVKEEVAARGGENFVASSEFLYTILSVNPNTVEDLKNQLVSIFGDVKIIIYLRDQVSFLKSVYAQRIFGPTRETLRFPDFLKKLEDLQILYRYEAHLQLWSSVFGAEALEPAVFSRHNFPNGNLIEDFCHRIDIRYNQGWYAGAAPRANVAPSFSHLRFLRALNTMPAGSDWTRRYGYGVLKHVIPNRDFPRGYDSDVIRLVNEENKRLNARYFSDSPVKLPVADTSGSGG